MRARTHKPAATTVAWIAAAMMTLAAFGQNADGGAAAIEPLAVVEFKPGADLAERDTWITTAVEETLTRRLRRAPGLAVTPTARMHQARRELRERRDNPPAEWTRVLRLTGTRRWLRGTCSGSPRSLSIELELVTLGDAEKTAARGVVGPGRLMEVLDQATRWTLDALGTQPLDQNAERLVFATPAKSPSALEFHAKALNAARDNDLRKASYYVGDAIGYDRAYRPALLTMARLALHSGGANLTRVDAYTQQVKTLATAAGDTFDEADFEIIQGLILLMTGSSEPALQRFERALTLSRNHGDPFGETEALSHTAECWLSRRPSPGEQLSDQQRADFRADNLRRAAEQQRLVLDALKRIGDVLSEVAAANKLALIYEQLDMPDEALAMHQRATAAARQTASARNQATALTFLGRFYRDQKRWKEALETTQQCLALASAEATPMVRMALAETYRGMSSPRDALKQYETAYQTLAEGTDLAAQLSCLRAIADLQMELGDRKAAVARLTEALDIAEALGIPDEQVIRNKLKKWGAVTP